MIISLGSIIFGGGSSSGGGSNAEMEEIQYVISCALNDLNIRLLNDHKQFSDGIFDVNYALAKTNYNLDKLTDRVMDNEEVTAQALNELKNGTANTTA